MIDCTLLPRHVRNAAAAVCVALVAGFAGTVAQAQDAAPSPEEQASYESCVVRCAFNEPISACVGDCAQQHGETAPADSAAILKCVTDTEGCASAADTCSKHLEDRTAFENCIESKGQCTGAAETCLSNKRTGEASEG